MPTRLEALYVSKRGESFMPYLLSNDKLRQIDPNKLSSAIVSGEERSGLRILSTGDFSLLVKLKERPGVISSFTSVGSDLRVDQLQGARQEGYRVSSALKWAIFFADEILEIAKHPESGVERLTMSPLYAIQGLIEASSDRAEQRYYDFATRSRMRFSDEEMLFVRDVRS